MSKFTWNVKRVRAAQLIADGQLTDKAIAKEVGVSPWTLSEWKTHSEFRECVRLIVEQARRALMLKSLVAKESRILALADRQQRMQRVIEARAGQYKDVPGGDTGLLVRQVKFVKLYCSDHSTPPDNAEDETFSPERQTVEVEAYAVDTALLKEMREHEKQIAQELGEWTERHELTGSQGKDLPSLVINVNGALPAPASEADSDGNGD